MNQNIHLYASTTGTVYGNASFWSLTSENTQTISSQRHIDLEIIEDAQQGFFLLISPKGLYTADMQCASLAEAKQYAQQWLQIADNDWHNALLAAAS